MKNLNKEEFSIICLLSVNLYQNEVLRLVSTITNAWTNLINRYFNVVVVVWMVSLSVECRKFVDVVSTVDVQCALGWR